MSKLEFEMLVKKTLREKNMTMAELAEKVGISSAYCSDIVRGNRIGTKKRNQIIKILNLKINK